jgi:hypothetical protein
LRRYPKQIALLFLEFACKQQEEPMAAPNTIRSGVGFRHCTIFALNTNGLPDASSPSTAYAGVEVTGVKRLTINDPEPQQITHQGDDRIFAVDSLPATEALSGELVTGKVNDTVDAVLTGQSGITVGEAKLFGVQTDLKGFEEQIGIIAYRQTLDTTPGAQQVRRWEFRIIPVALAIPRENSYDQNPEERVYTLRPQIASKHLWGQTFTTTAGGFEEAQMLRGVAEYKPKLLAWKANNTATTFTLSPTVANNNTSKITVYVDGVQQTSGITINTGSVVFTTAPTTDAIVVAFYEVA